MNESTPSSYAYCTVLDPEMAFLTAQDKFDDILLQSVILQPDVPVFPEIFIWASPLLARTQFKDFFVHCIQHKAIIPRFRWCFREIGGFRKYGQSLVEDHRLGILADHELQDIILSLEHLMHTDFQPEIWKPECVAGSFHRKLAETLAVSEPPHKHSLVSETDYQIFSRIWDATAKWRLELLPHSFADQENNPASALGRADILRRLAKALGINAPGLQYLGELETLAKAGTNLDALRAFSLWINECYWATGSENFGANRIALTEIDTQSSILGVKALPHLASEPLDHLKIEFKIPSLRFLARENPAELVAARMEEGQHFFRFIRSWQGGNDNAANDAIYFAKVYERRLCSIGNKHGAHPDSANYCFLRKLLLPPYRQLLEVIPVSVSWQAAKSPGECLAALVGTVIFIESAASILAWKEKGLRTVNKYYQRTNLGMRQPSVDIVGK